MVNIAPKIRVSRDASVFQLIDGYLVSCDSNIAARLPVECIPEDDLEQKTPKGTPTQNNWEYIEKNLTANGLAKIAGPQVEYVEILPKPTAALLAELWQIPTKLTKKQPACYSVVDGVGVLQFKGCDWEIMKPLDLGVSPISIFNNTELDPRIRLMDPTSASDVKLVAEKIRDSKVKEEPITLDIETFGWDEFNQDGLCPWRGDIRMIQMAFGDEEICYIFDFGSRRDRKPYDKVAAMLCIYLPDSELWGQNFAFDMLWLSLLFDVNMGLCKIDDSMIWSKIAFSGVKPYRHNLAAICKRLGIECHDKTLQRADFGGYMLPDHYNYGAGDIYSTRKAIKESRRRGPLIEHEVRQTCNLMRVINHMNLNGYPIDSDLIRKEVAEKMQKYDTLALEIESRLGIPNASSQKELLAAIQKQVDSEIVSTEAAELRRHKHPIVDLIREYRGLGIAANYGKSMLQSIGRDPNRCHSQYKSLNPQASGRVASSKFIARKKGVEDFGFNALNAAKENTEFEDIGDVRKWVRAVEGRRLGAADLSGSHLKIALQHSGQLDVLDDMNIHADGHAVTTTVIAAQVLGPDHPLSQLESYYEARKNKDSEATDMRNLAKTGIYGQINLQSGPTFQSSLAKKGIIVDLGLANKVVEALWVRLPKVKKYVQKTANDAIRNARRLVDPTIHVPKTTDRDLILKRMDEKKPEFPMKPYCHVKIYSETGRFRYLPVYQKINKRGAIYDSISHAAVAGCMWPSVESDIMNNAIIKFYDNWVLKKPHMDIKVWGYVYDELDIDVKAEHAYEATEALVGYINAEWSRIFPGKTGVTGSVDDKMGKSWNEIK